MHHRHLSDGVRDDEGYDSTEEIRQDDARARELNGE